MDEAPREASASRVELETKIGFLEHTVDALNDVVLEQGRALEQLERRVASLESRIAGASGSETDEADPLSERPPHY